MEAILAIKDCRAGQDGVLIVEHSLDEAAGSHGDAGVGEALLVDDIVSDLHQLVLHSLLVQLVGVVEVLIQVLESEACAAGGGPGYESAVAVLAEDIAVDVLRIHLVLVSQDATETIGLQHGAGAQDEVAGVVELSGNNIGCHIQRVGDHDDHGFLRVLHDLAHDGAHDLGVGASQLQAVRSFARADGGASGDDDDVGITAILIGAQMELDVGAVHAGSSMAGVLGLAPSLVLVEVDESHLGSQLEISDLVGYGGTYIAGTDDNDFSSAVHFSKTPCNIEVRSDKSEAAQ